MDKTYRILLIDDDPFLLAMYGKALEGAGMEVVSVQRLERDSVSQVHALKPDLIVSDLVRPAPDGLQTLRTLRAKRHTRMIPFVFLSNTFDSNEQWLEEAAKLSATGYIVKAETTPQQVANILLKVLQDTEFRKQGFRNFNTSKSQVATT